MRFRRLTLEELKELHEEFIQFLSSNTITGEDWKKLKEEDYPKAEKLIEVFSDIVLEKTLSNIQYLEKREPKNVLFFNFKTDLIELIGVTIPNDSKINLTDESQIKSLALGDLKTKVDTFKTSKKYSLNREDEMFKMLNEGCLISEGNIFKEKAL